MSTWVELLRNAGKIQRSLACKSSRRSRLKSVLSYLAVGWCSISAVYAGSHRLECVPGTTTSINFHLCTGNTDFGVCKSDPNDSLFFTNATLNTTIKFTTKYEAASGGTDSLDATFDAPNHEFNPAHVDNTYAAVGSEFEFTTTVAVNNTGEKQFSINLQPGGRVDKLLDVLVTCEAPLQQTGSITIKKQISGTGNGTFNFSAINPTTTIGTIPTSFSITTAGGSGSSPVFGNLSAGQYQITENDPTGAGFKFDNVSCDNNTSSTTSTVIVNLASGS